MKKCLIIYPYFAHYRLPIIKEIFNSDFGWEFELVGDKNTFGGIRGIDPGLAKNQTSDGGLSWTFTPLIYFLGKRIPLWIQRGLLGRLLRKDYDAVIMLGSIYYVSYLAAIPILKFFKTPIIFWTHGFLGKDNFLITSLRHLLYTQAKALLLYGDKSKMIMERSGFYRKTKIHVIYNSMDYSQLESVIPNHDKGAIRESLFLNHNLPVVFASGRVNYCKRFDKLLEALNISINKHQIPFNLLIIGDGPELQKLKEMARDYEIEKYVKFVGAIYGAEVYSCMLSSDVCVIPGNVGLSAMHALSAGLPVISHNNFDEQMPEHEAIIEGKTGSFYESEDMGDLVSKIHLWILNPDLLNISKKYCTDIIKSRYSVDYQMKVIESCLTELDYD